MKLFFSFILSALGSMALADAAATQDLLNAIRDSNLPGVRIAIEQGADVNRKRFYDGYTPLMMSAEQNSPQITVVLIQAGADLNTTTLRNRTALQLAALNNSYESALVLSSEKNIDISHGNKQCALALAARDNFPKIVKLLANQADDICFDSAVRYAEKKQNTDIIKILNP